MPTESANLPLPGRLRAAVDAVAEQPIADTEKGFGVISAGRAVSAATLAAERPAALGADFTMPLLVLRDSALRHNAVAMATWCARAGVQLAPHGKTTMAPQLIARQLAAGAWGVTAATISQAQVFRAFGMPRVLIANELTEPAGIRWLAAELAADRDFECYVYADSVAGVTLLDRALQSGGGVTRPLNVLIELGFPGGRTGCRTVAEGVDTAAAVSATSTLEVAGVAGYEGGIGADSSPATLAAVASYCRQLRELARALRDRQPLPSAGSEPGSESLAAPRNPAFIISVGGSAYFDVVVRELTAGPGPEPDGPGPGGPEPGGPEPGGPEPGGPEPGGPEPGGPEPGGPEPVVVLRSGCYLTHDHGEYARVGPAARQRGPELIPALELWAPVLSRPEPTLALICAGRRDVSFDQGFPVPLRVRGADGALRGADRMTVTRLDDQHGYLSVPADAELVPGDLICLGISHPCTTFDKWRVIPVVDDEYRVIDAVHTFF